MKKSVLFVCLGNICRSPLAEGIFKAKSKDAGLDVIVDSAATGGWHIGEPPDARAIVAARLRGYSIEGQVARRVSVVDFETSDLIVAMDETNRQDIEALRPPGSTTPVVLLSSFGPPDGPSEVPDPYYTGKFDPVISMVEGCADALVSQLLTERQ
ncbi:low molecular weight protein-tyrosine-phosphatase [Litoreibacter albidus]|uniref:low molecular weight protein-tyrosine-phosphatase n=1 Tax=Litoreibacter albidus TaxID=670155 RepID=UPI003734FB85